MEEILWVIFWVAVIFIMDKYSDVIFSDSWILIVVIAVIFGARYLWKITH